MKEGEVTIFEILEFSVGRKFGLLGRLYLSTLAGKLKHLGIKKHFSILVLVDRVGDHCSQKFIADTLHIDKAMMVGALDELEEKGLIKRVQNPSDRREYWVQLTAKGKKFMPEVKAAVSEINGTIMKGLSTAEVAKFHRQLKTIYANLRGTQKQKTLKGI